MMFLLPETKGRGPDVTSIDLNCDLGEIPALRPRRHRRRASWLRSRPRTSRAAAMRATRPSMEQTRALRDPPRRRDRRAPELSRPRRLRPHELAASTPDEVEAFVLAQIRELSRSVADAARGARLVHVKPHGALYHAASRDPRSPPRSRAPRRASMPASSSSGSPDLRCSRPGARTGSTSPAEASPIAATRPDGALRARSQPDALITDPAAAAEQAVRIATGRGGGRVATGRSCRSRRTPSAFTATRPARSRSRARSARRSRRGRAGEGAGPPVLEFYPASSDAVRLESSARDRDRRRPVREATRPIDDRRGRGAVGTGAGRRIPDDVAADRRPRPDAAPRGVDRALALPAVLRVIFLRGITIAGLSVIDLPALSARTKLPVVAASRTAPDESTLAAALDAAGFPGRKAVLARAGPAIAWRNLHLESAGIAPHEACALVDLFSAKSSFPSPSASRTSSRARSSTARVGGRSDERLFRCGPLGSLVRGPQASWPASGRVPDSRRSASPGCRPGGLRSAQVHDSPDRESYATYRDSAFGAIEARNATRCLVIASESASRSTAFSRM